MGEKDILEKKLFMFNDVFADFLNGIIFNGRQIVEESELFDLSGWSHYKADDSRHRYQDRDVVKLWKKKNVVKRKSPTVSATGSLVVNVIGVSQSQSFIGKMGLQQLFLKMNCHLSCQ